MKFFIFSLFAVALIGCGSASVSTETCIGKHCDATGPVARDLGKSGTSGKTKSSSGSAILWNWVVDEDSEEGQELAKIWHPAKRGMDNLIVMAANAAGLEYSVDDFEPYSKHDEGGKGIVLTYEQSALAKYKLTITRRWTEKVKKKAKKPKKGEKKAKSKTKLVVKEETETLQQGLDEELAEFYERCFNKIQGKPTTDPAPRVLANAAPAVSKVPVYSTPNGSTLLGNYPINEIVFEDNIVELINLINTYRKEHHLASIDRSPALEKVAIHHVFDLEKHYKHSKKCNPHSWSAHGDEKWKACCYTGAVTTYPCMWNKPSEISGFKGRGYETVYMTTGVATPSDALAGWKKSKSHNSIIVNKGKWIHENWRSIGVAVSEHYAVAWFAKEIDPSSKSAKAQDVEVDLETFKAAFNQYRSQESLGSVELNDALSVAAKRWAEVKRDERKKALKRPGKKGFGPSQFAHQSGYKADKLYTIASRFDVVDADTVASKWLFDKKLKKTLTQKGVTDIGLACVEASYDTRKESVPSTVCVLLLANKKENLMDLLRKKTGASSP